MEIGVWYTIVGTHVYNIYTYHSIIIILCARVSLLYHNIIRAAWVDKILLSIFITSLKVYIRHKIYTYMMYFYYPVCVKKTRS